MRGRFPLAVALALLTSIPPAQALSAGGSLAASAAGRTGSAQDEVCIDTGSLFDDKDPWDVVTIAAYCTVGASVSVRYTEEGKLVVTVVVAYADYGHTLVVECTDPQHLPKVGDATQWYGPCSVQEWKKWLT